MGFRIKEWNGPEIAAKVKRASIDAIDELTERMDEDASGSHWWQSRTGRLESQIITEKAVATPTGAKGRFGTTEHQGFYGLILERRFPFLRPAFDRHARELAGAIRKRLD